MIIEFTPDARQDPDILTHVAQKGLLGITVSIESRETNVEVVEVVKIGWDEPNEAYGLLLHSEDTNTETFVSFNSEFKVVVQ